MLFSRRKKIQKGELRDINVDYVSLLFGTMKPANGKGYVFKGINGDKKMVKAVTKKKVKSEVVDGSGYLYVTVMEPDTKDTQGDFATKDEIQKACETFAKKGMVNKSDINHNGKPISDFFIAENYILKAEDKNHFPDSKLGSWVQVHKCDNLESDYWKEVKKGNFNGVSIAGDARDIPNKKTKETNNKDKQSENSNESSKKNDHEDKNEKTKETEQNDVSVEIAKLQEKLAKAINKGIKGEEEKMDKEVTINGLKMKLKADKKELYKGFSSLDAGQSMSIIPENVMTQFIDDIIEQSNDTLSEISIIPITKDESIDLGLIDDIVLSNELDGSINPQDITESDLQCPTSILRAEITLKRSTVEFYKDKYGEAEFGAYVEKMIVKKVEKAFRKLLFQGDRTSENTAIKAIDGIIKKAEKSSKIITMPASDSWISRLEYCLSKFPAEILEDQDSFVYYVSHTNLLKIKSELRKRQTAIGDNFILNKDNLTFDGKPVKGRIMNDDYIIMGMPKFIIVGIRTNAEMKVEHHGQDWKFHWYIRLRAGVTYLNNYVKVLKITEPEAPTQQ